MNYRRHLLLLNFLVLSLVVSLAKADPLAVVDKLLAPPTIQMAKGLSAHLLIAPGKLYDPLILLPMGEATWLNDDGGEEKDKGSRLLSISPQGEISILADIGKLLPTVGFDIAPDGFGSYAGQVFSLAQPKVAMPGALSNHVVQRIEPARDFATSIFCTLPDAGAKKISGFGLDARFGPNGSQFANKLFVVTIYNDAIYQVNATGECTPFVVFDGKRYSAPATITFTPDGQRMLVTVSVGVFDITSLDPPRGAIVAIAADGSIDPKPLFEGPGKPMGMAFAPAGFGDFGGQLFFADVGRYEVPVPMTQVLQADGKIFRLTGDGKAEQVASGFFNPVGVQFVHGKLWVSDINGDFIAGKRELPDGFIVEISSP
ncbi:MAG: hypothetical protein O3C28_00305 [Proteobacteria bacterium]|nr:hypothetical protein [Pseudomonadota bacterium]